MPHDCAGYAVQDGKVWHLVSRPGEPRHDYKRPISLQTGVINVGRAQLKRKPQVVYQSTEGPTSDRIRHSEGFFEIGGEDRASQKYSMLDSPLDRLKARDAIGPKEYAALKKYGHHWYHGGLLSSCGSMDLGRIFASDPLSMSGMAKSEKQYHHRQQYRDAREEIGHRPGIVVDNIVCAEWPLHIAGHCIGYASPYRARQAATEILCDAGYRLARWWGIG